MVGGFFLLMSTVAIFVSAIVVLSNFLTKVIDAIRDPNWVSDPVVGEGYPYTNSKGNTYYLHLDKKLTAKGNVNQLYFFSRDQMENAVPLLPAGYEVRELSNGLPILKLNT